MLFLMILCVALYVIVQLVRTVLPQRFFVPPHNWRERIQKVLDYPKPIYLKVGSKRSSYRRRLILASSCPSFYTNFMNNKLKIHDEDKENKQAFQEEMKIRDGSDPRRKILFGFFHPYANNGGGGEKVLWQAVKATLLSDDRNIAVIYTTNLDAQPLDILNKAEEKLNVKNIDSKRVVFIYLRRFGNLISESYWTHFTIIGQLLGSGLLSLEAMNELSPDIWIDTIGLPGSYWLVSVALKIPILSYVHYPILQKEMFNKLKFPEFSMNQLRKFKGTASDFFALGKLIYWSILYYTYKFLGSKVDITLTNGTWTYNHLSTVWSLNMNRKFEILYPPCGPAAQTNEILPTEKENKLIYVAQFRPEKRHELILLEYSKFLKSFSSQKGQVRDLPTIVFLGSCRTKDDTSVLNDLRETIKRLDLENYVELVIDCPYDQMISYLRKSKYGLNAMWNEHFGIGVVEYLSYKVVPICHASAGPWIDIVVEEGVPNTKWYNNVGFFFKSCSDPDFDETLQRSDTELLTFNMKNSNASDGKPIDFPNLSQLFIKLFISHTEMVTANHITTMNKRGLEIAEDRFSDRAFAEKWMSYVEDLKMLERSYREEKRSGVETVY
ncbi:uncharacterized protein PRCAT00000148001 [Priceomyces carsonii]|uniref:uncharacterized protein n=1 Tax=Priceomyces carsonii TaxID=28549 RepID=UPI002EDB162C|nr:unnamed protein product [Priceomyces carsonii]